MQIAIGVAAVAVAAAAVYGWNGLKKTHEYSTSDYMEAEKARPVGPAFNPDSAYSFVLQQCELGPRPMNTAAHDRCVSYLKSKFAQYGCKVHTQQADLKGYDGTLLHATNILARFNPNNPERILICAHYDTRPWADNDPDTANWRKPIVAANDGASGPGVMIELARLLQQTQKQGETSTPAVGVDFLCLDAEDWGTPQWADATDDADTWALGAQYFATHLPEGFTARYGILLDMVGGQGARFYREGVSKQYAPDIVKKVWKAARHAGFGHFFPNSDGGMVTDDHVPLNEKAAIPTIDIIPYYPDCKQSSFGPTWHTLADDMDHIDKRTLQAVGQTIVQVIYSEEKQD